MKRPEKHPDEVVNEMLEVATKYGYGVETIRLTWMSGIPNSEYMILQYGGKNELATD